MPAVNKTANYELNQWQSNEYPKRQDFVDDNAKIDAALKENADVIATKQALTDTLPAEINIADEDAIPFYDASETAHRKTPWSNIKAKLKTYYDTMYAAAFHGHTKSQISDFPTAMPPTSHSHTEHDLPDASTSVKGIVRLNSAVNSTSETQAATPKAVKTAYDLANGKAAAAHSHGNLTSDGKIGSAANLPVFTGTGGIVGTKSVDDALKALGAQRSTPNEVISATWNESLAASSQVIKTISHSLGALPSKLIIRMIRIGTSSEIIMKYNGSSYDTLIYGTIRDLSNYDSTSYWTPAMVDSNYIFGRLSNFYCGGQAIGSLEFQLRSISVTDTQVSFTIYNNSSISLNISSNVTMEVYK
jgi:hypothetical protein